MLGFRKSAWKPVLNVHMPYLIFGFILCVYVRLKRHLFCFLSIVYDPTCHLMSEDEKIPVAIFLLEFENKKVIRDGDEKKGNSVGTASYFC